MRSFMNFLPFRLILTSFVLTSGVVLAAAAEPESADLRYFRELVETRN
jgi:hypothetical protein